MNTVGKIDQRPVSSIFVRPFVVAKVEGVKALSNLIGLLRQYIDVTGKAMSSQINSKLLLRSNDTAYSLRFT